MAGAQTHAQMQQMDMGAGLDGLDPELLSDWMSIAAQPAEGATAATRVPRKLRMALLKMLRKKYPEAELPEIIRRWTDLETIMLSGMNFANAQRELANLSDV
jgi:hypothetical protein